MAVRLALSVSWRPCVSSASAALLHHPTKLLESGEAFVVIWSQPKIDESSGSRAVDQPPRYVSKLFGKESSGRSTVEKSAGTTLISMPHVLSWSAASWANETRWGLPDRT